MFIDAAPWVHRWPVVAAALLLAALLVGTGARRRRGLSADRYDPRMAWLRAGAYFCLCVALASAAGVLGTVLSSPLVTDAQWQDPIWWGLSSTCLLVVVVGYGWIWPRGTFTDGRRFRPWLAGGYGVVWGACQGLVFLCLWALAERSGLAAGWVALISYALIGAYNGLLHARYWDIRVSPPHNYSEWNARKVLWCHTPNLVCCLAWLALYGNAGLFVLLQALALSASAVAMRFPAWWDDYDASPGEERTRAVA